MNYGKWAFGLALAALVVAVAGVAFLAGRMGSDDSSGSSVASSSNVETSSERKAEPDADADESYLTLVQADYETLTKLHDEVNERVNDGSYSNGGVHWSVHHDRWAAIIDDVYTENLKVSPPTEHASFHASWIAALQGFAEASEDMKAMSEAGYAIIDGPNQADLFTILGHLETGRRSTDEVVSDQPGLVAQPNDSVSGTGSTSTQPTESWTVPDMGVVLDPEAAFTTAAREYDKDAERQSAYDKWVYKVTDSEYEETFSAGFDTEIREVPSNGQLRHLSLVASKRFGMDIPIDVKRVFHQSAPDAYRGLLQREEIAGWQVSTTDLFIFAALYLDSLIQQAK